MDCHRKVGLVAKAGEKEKLAVAPPKTFCAAVLATAAAFSIQSWAQSVLPSTHIALLLTMEPVFAWITSFLVMGERLGLRPASGALLILAGIALTELVPQPHVPTAHEA